MNKGTILRTVLRVAVSLQTAICMTTAVITDFNNKSLILAWAIFAIVCDFVIAFITTYYNNDYTVEGDVGTTVTREMKANRLNNVYVEEPEDAEVLDNDEE